MDHVWIMLWVIIWICIAMAILWISIAMVIYIFVYFLQMQGIYEKQTKNEK